MLLLVALFAGITLSAPVFAQDAKLGMEDVKARLESEKIAGLYARTYESLLSRVKDNGYMQESLTGAYSGMFPRTVGGMVSLLLETDELDACERLIGYTLHASEVNGLERIAHVIGDSQPVMEPVISEGIIGQAEHKIALYRLDQPERFGGAQGFIGPDKPLQAIEVFLSGEACEGAVNLEIAETIDDEPLVSVSVDAASITGSGGWVRFYFEPALNLETQKKYVMRLIATGKGVPVWWGIVDAPEQPYGHGWGRDTQMAPGYMGLDTNITAFVLDTGDLTRELKKMEPPIYCDRDQIDGQAHVIMSWARLALRRGPTEFEERTWPQVAKLMDRSSDWPYLSPFNKDNAMLVAETGLVRNVCFEHSREFRFWDTFDILTQSFVAAALTDMVRVAQRRDDEKHATLWANRLSSLERAIELRMTRELDGKPVYLEMRLPNSAGGVPFEGLGWVNLGPVAAQWEGIDRERLANTINAYRERAAFEWRGYKALATDWWPDKPLEKAVIGKGVGWEIVYCLQAGEPERICEWLDLIAAANSTPIYMESSGPGADGEWHVGDPGNGEQCSWWCWGIAKARKAVGLSAVVEIPE